MRATPHCKINLGLHVTGQRPDGYHTIETIFMPVYHMCDSLEIVPSTAPAIEVGGIALDSAPEDNLCMKAWQLMHDEYGVPPVLIRLHKNIPYGAGLGGGSSDAAFTLRLLNQKYLNLPGATLERLAAQIGADCPFFVRNRTVYATGIGDEMTRIGAFAPKGWHIVVEMPEGEHVSTKEAYSNLDTSLFGAKRPNLREAIRRPIVEWRDTIVNDFESSVFPSHPAIADLKEEMYRRGALYASMTGSGAAVFGIFSTRR